jgi:hypothetical protein
MAEKEGFEPSMGFKAHTPLAGERLRPLGHLSVSWRTYYCLTKISQTLFRKPNFIWSVFKHIVVFIAHKGKSTPLTDEIFHQEPKTVAL